MSENNHAFRIQQGKVKGHGGDITGSRELH